VAAWGIGVGGEAAADTEAQFVLAGSGAWTTVRNGKRAMSFKELQASLA
jgi:hypothetical protein